jgi:hypothetical protein
VRIESLYDEVYKWGNKAYDAGEEAIGEKALAAADLLRQAADLYYGADEDAT